MNQEISMSFKNTSAVKKNSRPKTLLSVAIGLALGVVASPELFAADDGALKVYGRAHASVDYVDNGEDGDFNVASNSSRIGVTGSTELVEGIRGILQIETQINYDNGNGSLAGRDSFVGLEGGFGRVRIGQIDTPLKQIRGAVDFFGDQLGDLRNVTRFNGSTGAPFSGQDFDARFKNGVYYNTPSAGGFIWNLHYTPETNENANLADDSAAYSTSFVYNTSNLYLSLAYEQWEINNDSNAIRFGARYVAGNWTFGGLAQQATVKNIAVDEKVDTYGVGASYKVSPKVLVKGQVYAIDGETDETGATLVAIGADYILSKQLRLLFAYAQTDNDELARYRVTGGGGYGDAIATVVGETASGLSFGVRYDF
jgi:predicted porin